MSQAQYERKKRLDEKLAKAPASVRTQTLRTFDRIQFATDQDFEDYLAETETNVSALNQEIADNGLAGSARKPLVGGGGSGGVSPGIQAYIDGKSGADGLGGMKV